MTNEEINKIEVQREILKEIIKKIINRIKELRKRLEKEKIEDLQFGYFNDCSSFYGRQIVETNAIISELISQKNLL